jgi:hypothetical protein
MTPYELALYIESFYESKEAELKERLTLVWLGEYYHRTKKLPSLRSELKKISVGNKPKMTDQEMLEMAKRLNAQFGGTFEKSGD